MHSLTQSREYLRDQRDGIYHRERDSARDRERFRDSRGQNRYFARSCRLSMQLLLFRK